MAGPARVSGLPREPKARVRAGRQVKRSMHEMKKRCVLFSSIPATRLYVDKRHEMAGPEMSTAPQSVAIRDLTVH
jgi:hypothetical protein